MFREQIKRVSALIDQCSYTEEGRELLAEEALERCQFLLLQTKKMGGTVYIVGNGGSLSIATHFAADLSHTLGIPASALAEPSFLTALANDKGYERVYANPLQLRMTGCDLLIAISSSGASKSILNAASVAKERKAPIITLSGFDRENPLREKGDLNFWIASSEYGLVETAHFYLLHTLIDSLNPCLTKSKLSKLSAT